MRLSVTKAISEIGRKKFQAMMFAGAFPKVEYAQNSKNGLSWETYNMMEYSLTWSTFMKVFDARIKEKTGDTLGIFSRKHSGQFLVQLKEIVENITETDVFTQSERFRTMWD